MVAYKRNAFLYSFIGIVLCITSSSLITVNNSSEQNELLVSKVIIKGIDNYSLEIETSYLNDSSFLANGWEFDRNSVVTQQNLIFRHYDSIIQKKRHDVRLRKPQKKGNSNSIALLDNVIRGVALVKGKKGSIYKIEGSGGCNTCSEYYAFYSLTGEKMWYTYNSITDNFHFEKGNYSNIINNIGVSDTLDIDPIINGIWVFPPQYAGRIYQVNLR